MKNPDLVKAFETLMARNGRPVTAINRGGRGSPQEYRMSDGATTRLRTNQRPALMSRPANEKSGVVQPVDAPLTFEANDYVGVIFPHPDRPGIAIAYLVPSKVAAAEMKRNQKAWMDADPNHDRDNRAFVIRFDNPPSDFPNNLDYANKWSKYRVGEIALEPVTVALEPVAAVAAAQARQSLADIVGRHKAQLAAETGYPESAIRITFTS
jgi:hypothetical protein